LQAPDEGIADVIAAKLDTDTHLSARKLAQALLIAASMVCWYLTEVLGMKFRHLHWVPHTLTTAQKRERVELAERMLQALAKYKRNHFHFLFTGEEPSMFYAYNHRTMWGPSWDDVDEIERPSHFPQETMLMIFFKERESAKLRYSQPAKR
jgi:hypothetical protein